MTVVTRFAPSPTGFLHIGGARTALFNWLFSRHHGGRFLLRIEDTDRQRSTAEAIDAILEGLTWLGLDWDDDPLFQSTRAERHAEVARRLLDEGKAYRCYASQEELEEMRRQAKAEGRPMRYDGRWRDRDPAEAPPGVAPVIRIKMPRVGETVIDDKVQGRVTIDNEQLDDLVMLRADGSPTYMLSVVVDDHDMGITDVIRGDNHLTNAFRQTQIYRAMGWEPPAFAHIPLIHGPDGAKLSKRHGALGVEAYRDMGYLPEAMLNWLARLGWSHGDQEIFSAQEIVEHFDLEHVGRSGARADLAKLDWLCQHYLKQRSAADLCEAASPFLDAVAGHPVARDESIDRLLDLLRERSNQLVEMAEKARFALVDEIEIDPNAAKKHLRPVALEPLESLIVALEGLEEWTVTSLENAFEATCKALGDLKLGKLAQPVRVAVTGTGASPGIYETLEVVGRERSLDRLRKAAELIRARASED